MLAKSFKRVVRTRGMIAAGTGRKGKKAHQGRQHILIALDEHTRDGGKHAIDNFYGIDHFAF